MKKTILAIALFTGFGLAVNAQEPTTGKAKHRQKELTVDERTKQNVLKFEKELGLSAEQKIKWETAAKERILANQPLHEKLKGSTTPEERKALRKQAKINNDKFNNSVSSILSPEQKAKFEKLKEERRNSAKAKKGRVHQKADEKQDVIKE